jgi:hypothetical protein
MFWGLKLTPIDKLDMSLENSFKGYKFYFDSFQFESKMRIYEPQNGEVHKIIISMRLKLCIVEFIYLLWSFYYY